MPRPGTNQNSWTVIVQQARHTRRHIDYLKVASEGLPSGCRHGKPIHFYQLLRKVT
tara:strand:- start:268 stop:435 length:168 start_codon:yes stop_codon:yes gene_type:complete